MLVKQVKDGLCLQGTTIAAEPIFRVDRAGKR